MVQPVKINLQELRALVSSGMPRCEIAVHFGVSRSAVTQACNRMAKVRFLRADPGYKIDRARLEEMTARGLRNEEIADAFQCDASAISKARKRWGIEKPDIKRPPPPRHKALAPAPSQPIPYTYAEMQTLAAEVGQVEAQRRMHGRRV